MSVEMDEITVEDDEGVVDRKTKEHILRLRFQVDEDERELFVEKASDPDIRLSVMEANSYWGISVRQFLRGIKRLWGTDPDVDGVRSVNEFWQEKKIGEETLIPPDKNDYQFSLVATANLGTEELKQRLGLPRRSELPQPVKKEFYGLNSILSQNRVEQTWVVKTDTTGPPPQHESVVLHQAYPLPKHLLENAVELADNFLQQAGLGFEVGVPDYYGGEEAGI